MEATGAQLEASAMSSQTSLLLPWQPGSEKRITWTKRREESSGSVLSSRLLPPLPHTCPPPLTFPGLVFSLPWVFNAGLWNGGGDKKSNRLPAYCLPPPAIPGIPHPPYQPPPPPRAPHLSQPALSRSWALSLPFSSFQEIAVTKVFGIDRANLLCLDRETEAQRDVACTGSH